MTNTEPRIADTDWRLIDITYTRLGWSCDHCDRIVKRGFFIRDTHGRKMRVGQGCVKKLTGWSLTEAQAKGAMRAAEHDARVEMVRAAYPALSQNDASGVALVKANFRAEWMWRRHAEDVLATRERLARR